MDSRGYRDQNRALGSHGRKLRCAFAGVFAGGILASSDTRSKPAPPIRPEAPSLAIGRTLVGPHIDNGIALKLLQFLQARNEPGIMHLIIAHIERAILAKRTTKGAFT